MSIYNYKNPIIYTKRAGTSDDPFPHIEELHIVHNNRILLTEVPDEIHHVNVEVKAYAKARLKFNTDVISGSHTIVIAGQTYNLPNGNIKYVLRELAEGINAISTQVNATYFLATKSLHVVAKNAGIIGNAIIVSSGTSIASWVDTADNPTSILTGGSDVSTAYFEVYNSAPKQNEFKVDYTDGLVNFHESVNGLCVKVKYYGKGISFFPASRVYTKTDGYTVTETLNDYLEMVDELFQDLADIDNNLLAKNSWDANAIYFKRNIVEHNGNGYMYVGNVPMAGENPEVSSNWRLIVKRGLQGFPGLDLHYDGVWDNTKNYTNQNVWVSWQGKAYHPLIVPNLNKQPDLEPTYWSTFSGDGDMKKTIYDTNSNGKVDIAENAEKLGNRLSGNASNNIPINNTLLSQDLNADMLDGKHYNDIHNEIQTVDNKIGALSQLKTKNKNSVKDSINEIVDRIEFVVPTTFYVDGINGYDSNNGTSMISAFKTIDKAIASISNGSKGIIYLKGGQTYTINPSTVERVHEIINRNILIITDGVTDFHNSGEPSYATVENLSFVETSPAEGSGNFNKTSGLILIGSTLNFAYLNVQTASLSIGGEPLSVREGMVNRASSNSSVSFYQCNITLRGTNLLHFSYSTTISTSISLFGISGGHTLKRANGGYIIYHEGGVIGNYIRVGGNILKEDNTSIQDKDLIYGIIRDGNGVPRNVTSNIVL